MFAREIIIIILSDKPVDRPYSITRKFSLPYGGLLSSTCRGLKGTLGSKVILPDKKTDERTTGLRELDITDHC